MNLIKYRNYRKTDKAIIIRLLIFLFITATLFHCSDRNRSNIFDPSSGIDTLDIKLYVSSADTVITVRWSAPYKVQFIGYNLYRKANNEEDFHLIASPKLNQLEFVDQNVSFDVSYQYYITVQGEESESPPSQLLSVTPGPVTFIVLDPWGYVIYRLTYDLQHILQTRYTTWRAENLAFDPLDNLILVTYPQLSYIEIYNRSSGSTESSSSDFSRPFDCIYNNTEKNFWFTDSSGFVYSIAPITGASQLIDQNLKRPTQMAQSDQAIYVLESDAAQIVTYNLTGERLGIIRDMGDSLLHNPLYIKYANNSQHLYIIDKVSNENRILYRYSTLTESAEIFFQNNYINKVQIDPSDNSIWVSVNELENSVLMQLSPDGIRLNEVTGFSGIADFKINTESNTIVVADYVERVVKHIRPNSSVIGVFQDAFYPSKVYVE